MKIAGICLFIIAGIFIYEAALLQSIFDYSNSSTPSDINPQSIDNILQSADEKILKIKVAFLFQVFLLATAGIALFVQPSNVKDEISEEQKKD